MKTNKEDKYVIGCNMMDDVVFGIDYYDSRDGLLRYIKILNKKEAAKEIKRLCCGSDDVVAYKLVQVTFK